MWSSQEAVYHLAEIAETRRRILEKEAFDQIALAASRVTLTRAQLAD
jgi:hypothetical protein